MIKAISLQNFKCFKNQTSFDLKDINIFTGYNGRGKSTALQAILLLAQSIRHFDSLSWLVTKGCYLNLDLFEDLLTKGIEGEKILSIDLASELPGYERIGLRYQEKGEQIGSLIDFLINEESRFDNSKMFGVNLDKDTMSNYFYPEDINDLFANVVFVSADRRGPSLFEQKELLDKENPCGVEGEHTLNVISRDEELNAQINELTSFIMDGGKIDIKGKDKDSAVLSLRYSTIDGQHQIKSVNHGFGYSYVLPILAAALRCKDGMLIIENPEAHLHPAAQSRLPQALVKICKNNNTQLFLETHSEHILNAVRLCTLKPEFGISHDDVSIYFFDKDFTVIPLKLDADGQIDPWPEGFFDQQENDLAEILQLGLFNPNK